MQESDAARAPAPVTVVSHGGADVCRVRQIVVYTDLAASPAFALRMLGRAATIW